MGLVQRWRVWPPALECSVILLEEEFSKNLDFCGFEIQYILYTIILYYTNILETLTYVKNVDYDMLT